MATGETWICTSIRSRFPPSRRPSTHGAPSPTHTSPSAIGWADSWCSRRAYCRTAGKSCTGYRYRRKGRGASRSGRFRKGGWQRSSVFSASQPNAGDVPCENSAARNWNFGSPHTRGRNLQFEYGHTRGRLPGRRGKRRAKDKWIDAWCLLTRNDQSSQKCITA
jgi:hypothetical protein